MAWGLFGLDVENVAKNEVWDPTKGGYKEDVGDRFGNWIVGALSGGSDRKAEIDALVKAAHIKNLEDTYGADIDKYGTVQGMETISRDDLAKLDSAELNRKLLRNKSTKDALSYVTEAYGIDPSEFAGITDPATIKGKGAKQYNKNQENKGETKYQQRRQESKDDSAALLKEQNSRADALLRAQNNRQDFLLEQQNLRADRRDAQARLDRLENRRMTADTNRMSMQLEYDRMAQNDLYRQQDKKDKALMMLLQGLGNLGAAFTI